MRFVSALLLAMIGVPLVVSLGVALALVAMAVTAHAGERQCGVASWYSSGHTTAEGRPYYPDAVSVAHRSYRFGTMLRIVDQTTGRAIVARVGDRGPFVRGRIVDLSRGAARRLGMIARGTVMVCVERVR